MTYTTYTQQMLYYIIKTHVGSFVYTHYAAGLYSYINFHILSLVNYEQMIF